MIHYNDFKRLRGQSQIQNYYQPRLGANGVPLNTVQNTTLGGTGIVAAVTPATTTAGVNIPHKGMGALRDSVMDAVTSILDFVMAIQRIWYMIIVLISDISTRITTSNPVIGQSRRLVRHMPWPMLLGWIKDICVTNAPERWRYATTTSADTATNNLPPPQVMTLRHTLLNVQPCPVC